jgi:crotonobetainyl-CoA:carnitine CoA-transferase CaiB-like acyl-CoA transferase
MKALRPPLHGVKVVEFGHIAAGPFTGMLLGDLGADVVKVEPPGGDGMRHWPPIVRDDAEEFSLNFASLNRNKRSICLDLKRPHDHQLARELIQRADVVIENYRVGSLPRLGLGFSDVASQHRGLVYCSISGFGESGPYAHKGAFDVVVQAMSGLMSVTGTPGGPLVKCGVPVGDFVAGLYAAFVITAMLPSVRSSGQSVHLDCPMLDCLLGIAALQTSETVGTGMAPQPMGSAHPRNAPYQAFEAADRLVVIAAGTERLWQSVCECLGVPDLCHDSRFMTQTLRAKNQYELADILQPILRNRSAAAWCELLDARGVPCGVIQTYPEVLKGPHASERSLVRELTVPVAGAVDTVRFPVTMPGVESCWSPPPRLGADTANVLAEWLADATSGEGCAAAERSELRP